MRAWILAATMALAPLTSEARTISHEVTLPINSEGSAFFELPAFVGPQKLIKADVKVTTILRMDSTYTGTIRDACQNVYCLSDDDLYEDIVLDYIFDHQNSEISEEKIHYINENEKCLGDNTICSVRFFAEEKFVDRYRYSARERRGYVDPEYGYRLGLGEDPFRFDVDWVTESNVGVSTSGDFIATVKYTYASGGISSVPIPAAMPMLVGGLAFMACAVGMGRRSSRRSLSLGLF